MKNILFTIKTAYSEENYFLKANEEQPIESQIDNALAEIRCCAYFMAGRSICKT